MYVIQCIIPTVAPKVVKGLTVSSLTERMSLQNTRNVGMRATECGRENTIVVAIPDC